MHRAYCLCGWHFTVNLVSQDEIKVTVKDCNRITDPSRLGKTRMWSGHRGHEMTGWGGEPSTASGTQKWCPHPEHQDKLQGFRVRHTKDSHCCLAQGIWKKWLDISEHHFFYTWNGNKNTHLFTDKSHCYSIRKKWEDSTNTQQMEVKSEGRLAIDGDVQPLSCIQLFVTLWTAARQASLYFTIFRVCSKPCPLSWWCHPTWHPSYLLSPLLLLPSIFPSIRVFSSELVLWIRWPKYWSLSFSISPSNEHSGLISSSIDWFDLLAVQGTVKSLP